MSQKYISFHIYFSGKEHSLIIANVIRIEFKMLLYVMDSRNWHLNEYRIQQTQLTTTTFNILAQPVELYTGTSF